jgi:DNA invertase Pin-like site-specific DNA recombinase
MERAYSYLRVSGRGQISGDGFPRQREAIAKYARRHGVTIVQEFRDEGVSGTRELGSRPGLAALLDRLETNGVRVVLIERADRLARDLLVGEVILGQFRKIRVRVVDASGTNLSADDDDPTRILIRQVLGAVSQFEKAVVVLKLRAARDRMRIRTGRCEGRRPFGYYPHEQHTVDMIRALRRKPRGGHALSFAEVADQLNDRNASTRTGVPWSAGSVFAIMKRLTGSRPRLGRLPRPVPQKGVLRPTRKPL